MENSLYQNPKPHNSESSIPPEAIEESTSLAPQVDSKTWIALTYTALVMSLIYYYGKSSHILKFFPEKFQTLQATVSVPEYSFYLKMYWVVFGIVVYFIIPWIYLRCRGEKLRDYGVRLPSSYSHMWIYGAMLLIVIVMAYIASFKPSFQQQYPYYKYYLDAPLLYGLFWVGRAIRFFALEFFFRGYLLFSLKEKMGDSAFFVSMVPYCMLHFGKPFPETLFTIVGGIIFCWIAARTKSIWGAVVLHVALAVVMDFFSIAQKLNWI